MKRKRIMRMRKSSGIVAESNQLCALLRSLYNIVQGVGWYHLQPEASPWGLRNAGACVSRCPWYDDLGNRGRG